MNTKIIVALVIGIALIGLTGAASASLYDDYMARSSGNINTETVIMGTHFTSESSLKVSNFPIAESYQSKLVAEFRGSVFPPVDLSYMEKEISGDTFAEENTVVSTPTGSRTTTILRGLPQITGSLLEYTCVDMSTGGGSRLYDFPLEEEIGAIGWHSHHPAGSTYPGYIEKSVSIYWP